MQAPTMTAQHAAQRMQGLGSSDAAGALGLSPWDTPLHIFLTKKGQYQKRDRKELRSGRMREEIVAQAYQEETGLEVRPPRDVVMVHPVHPWMIASLDREAVDQGDEIVVELKNVGHDSDEWGEPGTDEVPAYYLTQCQHQLAVTGRRRADLAAMFWPDELRIYRIPRNEDLIGRMIRMERFFWRMVEENMAPEPDWMHPETPALIQACQRITARSVFILNDRDLVLAREYARLGRIAREAEREREVVKAQLLYGLRDAETGILPGGGKITRKTVHNKGCTVEPYSYVRFDVRLPKE